MKMVPPLTRYPSERELERSRQFRMLLSYIVASFICIALTAFCAGYLVAQYAVF